MENPSTVILSRMMTASHAMDVVANNIANASTPGYKSLHLGSTTWIDRMEDATPPDGGETIAFNAPRGTWRDEASGPIHQTGNTFDFALSGPGYFTVQTTQGTRLTRDGRFSLDSNGGLVNSDGDAVLDPSGNPITIPANQGTVSVAADGTISGATGVIGHLAVVDVPNVQALAAEGSNLFRAPAGFTPVQAPKIVQGALEDSNVQPVLEISDMLKVSQNFQMISQFLSSEHARQENAITKMTTSNPN